jgi:hypothetical protein
MFSVKFTYGVLAKSVEVEEALSAEVVESLAKLELCGVLIGFQRFRSWSLDDHPVGSLSLVFQGRVISG